MKKLGILFFFSFIFILYWFTNFSKVSFGDCIAFVLLADKGDYTKFATAENHFLYTNTIVFFKNLFNLNSILTIRLINIFSAILSLFFLFKSINLLFKTWLAYFGTLLFAISFTFWRTTSTIEVSTFNSIFLSLYLLYSIKVFKQSYPNALIWLGLILGISFWSHVQNVMLIPSYLYILIYFFKNQKKRVIISLILFLVLSIGKFIPALIYGYELINVYSSENKQWIEGTFNKTFLQYSKDLIKSLAYIFYNFWHFLLFAFLALYVFFKNIKQNLSAINLFFFIAFLFPFIFGTFYNVSDNYVYFIGPYQIILLLILYGLNYISSKQNIQYAIVTSIILIPFFYFFTLKLTQKTEAGKKFDIEKKYKGGLNYYLIPWLNNNVGIIEFTIENRKSTDSIYWMLDSAREYIKLKKEQNIPEKEIINY